MSLDTGIDGLEELVDIPEDFILMLGGTPGTGKEPFAIDYLYQGIEDDQQVLYISLTQTKEELKKTIRNRGFDPEAERLEIQEAVNLMRPGSGGQVFEPEQVTDGLRRRLNRLEPDRIVFNSLTKFLMIFDASPVQREHASNLLEQIRGYDSSALFLSEVPFSKEDQVSRYEIAEFVVDGVFHVKQDGDDTLFEIMKMKGLDYNGSPHLLEVTGDKVEITSKE